MMKEAFFYEKKGNSSVQCNTCRRHCVIPEGKTGFCRIRQTVNSKLYLLTYGQAYAPSIDPIEKKPFYHFWPGSSTYSFCTVGCNYSCLHCCNPYLSQSKPGDVPYEKMEPEKLVSEALKYKTPIISYTYTEPTVFFEYAYDTGVLARKKGLKNAFVTNGYATTEVIKKSKDFLDAARIDLKGDKKHYLEVCGGINVDGVLDAIKEYYKTGMHIEIITLAIEGDNDKKQWVDEMADFLKGMNDEIPWHFIAFFPSWKMMDKPFTSLKTLEKMHKWATDAGMKYVYAGNMETDLNNTYCPNCHELLIERKGFGAVVYLPENKKCPSCSTKIPIAGSV